MNKRAVIGLMLPAAFTRGSVTQSTPTASRSGQERQRIKLERKWAFGLDDPISKAKKGVMFSSADIGREMRRAGHERRRTFDPNSSTTKDAASMFPNVPTPERVGVGVKVLAK